MSCNTGFFNLDKCLKSIGGIKNMWVSPRLPLTYLSTDRNYDVIYFLGAAHEYMKLNIKDDSVSLTTEINVNDEVGNTSYTTNINIKQADLLANDLKQYANAELSVIFQDIQDRYYIVGYDNLCKMTTGSATSGAQLGDFNGVEITLTTSDRPVLLVTSHQQAEELEIPYYVVFNDGGISPSFAIELSEDRIILPQNNGVTYDIETVDNKLVVTCEYGDSLGLNENLLFSSQELTRYSQDFLECAIDIEQPQIKQILNYFDEKGIEEVFLKTISDKLVSSPKIWDGDGDLENMSNTDYNRGFALVNEDDFTFFNIELSSYIPKENIHNAILDVTVNVGRNTTNSNHILKFTINNLYLGMY